MGIVPWVIFWHLRTTPAYLNHSIDSPKWFRFHLFVLHYIEIYDSLLLVVQEWIHNMHVSYTKPLSKDFCIFAKNAMKKLQTVSHYSDEGLMAVTWTYSCRVYPKFSPITESSWWWTDHRGIPETKQKTGKILSLCFNRLILPNSIP